MPSATSVTRDGKHLRVGNEARDAPTRTVATGNELRFTNIINEIGRHITLFYARRKTKYGRRLVVIHRRENNYS